MLRRVIFVVGLLLLVAEAGAAALGVREALHLRQVALALQQDLRAAAQPLSSLSLSKLDSGALDGSEGHLRAASAEARTLLATTRTASRLLVLARRQPQAAAEARQADAALTAADDGSQLALGLLDLARALTGRPGGAPQGGQLLGALQSAQPQLAASLVASADVSRELGRVRGGRLARLVAPALGPVRADLPLLQRGLQLGVLAPAALGASGPVSYLVVAQNPADLRPTGGFMGSWGVLTVQGGRIAALDYRAYDKWEDVRDPKRAWPVQTPPVQRYLRFCCMAGQDANWYPDYPTTARVMEQFAAADQPAPIAGVVAFDPALVQALLRVTGPVDLPDLGVTVTADNVVPLANAYEGRGPDSTQQMKAVGKEFLVEVAQAIAKRLTQGPSVPWTTLAAALPALLQHKHVLVAPDDPQLAAWFASMGWDGDVTTPDGDYLLLDEMSMSDNKVDLDVARRFDDTVQLKADGSADVTLQVAWQNAYPYTTTREAGGGAGIAPTTAFRDYFRLYLPPGSAPGSMEGVDGVWPTSTEAGHTVMASFVVIPATGTRQATVRYHVPAAVLAGPNGPAYALHVQLQPGIPPPVFHLHLLAPDGATLADQTATLDQDTAWRIAVPGIAAATPPVSPAWDRTCAALELVAGLQGPRSSGRLSVPTDCGATPGPP